LFARVLGKPVKGVTDFPGSDIERENRALLDRQRQFRSAADVMTGAWMAFPVVDAIAGLICSSIRRSGSNCSMARAATAGLDQCGRKSNRRKGGP
jgi:hypothetical protein